MTGLPSHIDNLSTKYIYELHSGVRVRYTGRSRRLGYIFERVGEVKGQIYMRFWWNEIKAVVGIYPEDA